MSTDATAVLSACSFCSCSFTYDARGYPEAVTDARGHATTYAFDDLGRLTAGTNALGESTHLRYRGPSAELADFGQAPPGRHLSEIEVGESAAAGEGQLRRLRWDAEGRLARVERKEGAGTWSTFMTYAYDSDDNRLQATDATGRTLAFGYDALVSAPATQRTRSLR